MSRTIVSLLSESCFLSLSQSQCHFCNRFPGSLCFPSVSFHSQTKPFSFYPRILHSPSLVSKSEGLVLLCTLSTITKDCPFLFYKLSIFPCPLHNLPVCTTLSRISPISPSTSGGFFTWQVYVPLSSNCSFQRMMETS